MNDVDRSNRRQQPATRVDPITGAVSAIATVAAVMSALISPALTLNSRASVGSRACG